MAEQSYSDQQAHTPERRIRRAPPSSQQKQNVANHLPILDGALSDGALMNQSPASPRSKKNQRSKQNGAAGTSASKRYNNSASDGGQTKDHAPTSRGSTSIGTRANDDDTRYAGGVFSSSPAPNSLPVPKFAKSMSNTTKSPELFKRAHVRNPSETIESSPEAVIASPNAAPNSPLEMFFRADRAEKARTQSAVISPQDRKNIFLSEANGESAGQGYTSPRRPFFDRTHSSPGSATPVAGSEMDRITESTRLKALLFNTTNDSALRTPQTNCHEEPSRVLLEPLHSPSPSIRSGLVPATADHYEGTNEYHYGRRNLSPLFKAARGDPFFKSSGLSRETSYDGGRIAYPPLSQQQQSDSDHFARQVLDGQATVHQTFEPPHEPYTYPASSQHNNISQRIATEQHHLWNGGAGPASPRSTAPKDNATMENDLRRILRLDNAR